MKKRNKVMKKYIEKVSGIILCLCRGVEKINNCIPELLVCFLYTVAHFFMLYVHEPWYDEGVAWNIARRTSYWQMLFEVPHYEGHPQLWHLILSVFAKNGMPFELSLSIISYTFVMISIILILKFSPFPRIVRLLIPFTYFFFYQYGVISRPYCMMILAFVLLAISYEKRNQKPYWYVGSLMFLCMTSAYGIVIAGGIAIVWVIEVWSQTKKIRNFLCNKITIYLFGLLLFALALIYCIIPENDAFALEQTVLKEADSTGWMLRFLYMFCVVLSDVTYTNVYNEYAFLKNATLDAAQMRMGVLIGIIIWGIIIYYGMRQKKLSLFVVPFSLFAGFSALAYFYLHHSGIVLLLMLFWFWVIFKEDKTSIHSLVKDIEVLLVTGFIVVSFLWTVIACKNDYRETFSIGRDEAQYIKDHQLYQYNIMTAWEVTYNKDGTIKAMDTNFYGVADVVSAYFPHNIFYNFGYGKDELNYTTHKRATEEENMKNIELWREYGAPEVLFMRPKLEVIFDENVLDYDTYQLVYLGDSKRIWKDSICVGSRSLIYVRKDILEQTDISEITVRK